MKSRPSGKAPDAGKDLGKRRREWQRMRRLDSITHLMDMNLSKLWEIVEDRRACVLQSMGLQRVRHNLATEQQQYDKNTA